MKITACFTFLLIMLWQSEVKVTHHRADLAGKKLIGRYNFNIVKAGNEDNMAMIERGYDSAIAKAKKLDGTMVYINGRRWRYMGRKLVVITEIYED